MDRTFKDYALISLKGIAMGAADVVPGVSGGTIAFITGIYEELLGTIKHLPIAFKNFIKEGFNVVSFWKKANLSFLLALLSGIAISVISLAQLMQVLLATYPIVVWSFFFGLIIASSIYVLREIKCWSISVVISFIVGCAVAFGITVISPAQTSEAYWFIFLSGALAICAMILPGISGSFILLLLGKYHFIMKSISSFNIPVILCFGLGALVGIISFSSVLSWLLKKLHNITVGLLGGFMLGSLNKIWPWKETIETTVNSHGIPIPLVESNILPSTDSPALVGSAIAVVIGFGVVFVIEWLAGFITKQSTAN